MTFSYSKDKVFFIVGSEAISLAVASNKECKFFRVFPDYSSVNEFLLKNPLNEKIGIFLIIDTLEQKIDLINIISISYTNFRKNIQKELAKKIEGNCLVGHFGAYGEQSYQQNVNFLTADCEDNITRILSFLSHFKNPIEGIYSSITKSFFIYEDIRESYNAFLYKADITHWEIFAFHTSTGNIRLEIFKNKIFYSQNVVLLEDVNNHNLIATTIENLISNELARIDPSVSERVSIYIVTSLLVKALLNHLGLSADKLIIIDADEIRIRHQIRSKAVKQDFIDDLLITAAMDNKLAPLISKNTQKEMLFYLLCKVVNRALIFVLFVFISILIDFAVKYHYNKNNIDALTSSLAIVTENANNLTNSLKSSGVSDNIDAVNSYNLLLGNNKSIADILSKVASLRKDDVSIRKISWKLLETMNLTNQNAINLILHIHVNLKYGDDRDFVQFNQFVAEVKDVLKTYKVTFRRISQKIDNDANAQILPIELTINGPRNDL